MERCAIIAKDSFTEKRTQLQYANHVDYRLQLEGPMWRQIRGQGFAYSFSISVNVEHGLLYFSLYKATSMADAFREAINITKEHLEGKLFR